jgi:hypothetical protein
MSAKEEFLRREKQEILKAIALIEALLPRDALSQHEIIALGTLLQNVYMGIESVLRCLLLMKGIRIEKTEGWHQALLQRALREGFVRESEFGDFRELLKFRHAHIHGYGRMLDEPHLRKIAAPVPKFIRDYLERVISC